MLSDHVTIQVFNIFRFLLQNYQKKKCNFVDKYNPVGLEN